MFVALDACCSASALRFRTAHQELSPAADLSRPCVDVRPSLSIRPQLVKVAPASTTTLPSHALAVVCSLPSPRKLVPPRLAPSSTVRCAGQGDNDTTRAFEDALHAVRVHVRPPVVKEVGRRGARRQRHPFEQTHQRRWHPLYRRCRRRRPRRRARGGGRHGRAHGLGRPGGGRSCTPLSCARHQGWPPCAACRRARARLHGGGRKPRGGPPRTTPSRRGGWWRARLLGA